MNENLSQPPLEKPTVEEIQAKIKLLSTYQDHDLEGAMKDLKKALLQNPEACTLILPEEIGEMTRCLMKITDKIIVEAKEKEKKKKDDAVGKKPPKLTQEQIENLVDEM